MRDISDSQTQYTCTDGPVLRQRRERSRITSILNIIPGQQFFNPVDLVICDAAEDICEPGEPPPGLPEAVLFESRCRLLSFQHGLIARLGFGRRDVAHHLDGRRVTALVVETRLTEESSRA